MKYMVKPSDRALKQIYKIADTARQLAILMASDKGYSSYQDTLCAFFDPENMPWEYGEYMPEVQQVISLQIVSFAREVDIDLPWHRCHELTLTAFRDMLWQKPLPPEILPILNHLVALREVNFIDRLVVERKIA